VVIFYSFVALLSGFATITLLGLLASLLLRRFVPGCAQQTGRPEPIAVLVWLGSTLLTSAAGGYITTWTARGNPLVQVLVLAIAVLALSALNMLQTRGQRPVWFQLAQVVLAPLGVMCGCLLRVWVLGLL
jgi:hypothetical protein